MTAALGGQWSAARPRPHFTPGKDAVPVLQEAGWAPGPVWMGGISRPHRDSIPDRPASSRSLYRLSYPAHDVCVYIYIYICVCVCVCARARVDTHTHTHTHTHTRFVHKVSRLTTVHEIDKAYRVLTLIVLNTVPFRSYTLRPTFLPLLETFCKLLFRDV